jgi:hypothetical protein
MQHRQRKESKKKGSGHPSMLGKRNPWLSHITRNCKVSFISRIQAHYYKRKRESSQV